MRTIYRKTKRGSIIKVRDYSNEPQKIESNVVKFLFPKHLTQAEVSQRVTDGTAYIGTLQTNPDNLLEAYVAISFNGEDVHVLIQGAESINRALHDDKVAIELLPQNEWKAKSQFVVLPEQDADEDVSIAPENMTGKHSHQTPTGKVISIVKRCSRNYPGVIRRKNNASTSMIHCLFIPSDRRIPVVRIETRQYNILKNQRLVVAIDSWPRSSKFPIGHYVKSLGVIGDVKAENKVLLLEHDIPHSDFTSDVLSCLPPVDWVIPKSEFKYRLDLRTEYICSVDPPGCTDIDDALHYKDLTDTTCEVGVHIADVSFFVKPNTSLDCEASNRGTSVYLADRRIDMIPGHLSSNLCSLIEKQDRLAFSVIWTVKKSTAEIIETKFSRTVINSKASLTYQRAQEMIDDKNCKKPLNIALRGLLDLSKTLKKNRIDRGALTLARADEIRFVEVESEANAMDSTFEIQHKKLLDTNSMIEEFMLLANISVATHLVQQYPDLALLRRHPKPSRINFEDLINSAKTKGFEIETDDGKSLSNSLQQASLKNDDYFNLMLRMIATRCMTPASYFCSGCLDTKVLTYNHFGLAAELYTHFTSPIRRYADLLVHRLLAHSLKYDDLDLKLKNKDNLQVVCDRINYRHRMAQYASRASNRLHTILFIRSKREIIDDGYIFFVRQNAIQILIPKIAFEHTYFLQPISEWQFDPVNRTQTNTNLKIVLRQFDKIRVHITLAGDDNVRFSEKIRISIIKPALDKAKSGTKINEAPVEMDAEDTKPDVAIPTNFDTTFIETDQRFKAERHQFVAMKKKVRLNLCKRNNQNEPMVVLAGDNLTKVLGEKIVLLGPGLVKESSQIISTKCGLLKTRNNMFWIDNHQKRYVASKGDNIVGIIKSKASMHARVEINASDGAMLSLLAFESATKRNKPHINVGDAVFAKVFAGSRHIETELVCVSSVGKRDGLGILANKGSALVIQVSLETIRLLLNPLCDFLVQLGKEYKYEVALGMNGRIWVNSNDLSVTVRVARELHKFDVS